MVKKLAASAEKYRRAIVFVGHMNKVQEIRQHTETWVPRVFSVVVESVLLVGRIEGEANIRAGVQVKNNLAMFKHPKAFELSENGFCWLNDYEITADEGLGGLAPKANKMEQAKYLLRELTETNNSAQSSETVNLADKHGI